MIRKDHWLRSPETLGKKINPSLRYFAHYLKGILWFTIEIWLFQDLP